MIDTATKTVEAATLAVDGGPYGVGITPAVPFATFNAELQLDVDTKPAKDALALETSFTLSGSAPAITPLTQAVTFQAGPFEKIGPLFAYAGTISGVNLQAVITPTGTLRYAFAAAAEGPNLTGITKNPVPVGLTIGSGNGSASVNALIFH